MDEVTNEQWPERVINKCQHSEERSTKLDKHSATQYVAKTVTLDEPHDGSDSWYVHDIVDCATHVHHCSVTQPILLRQRLHSWYQ